MDRRGPEIGDMTASPPFGLVLAFQAQRIDAASYGVPPSPLLRVLAVYVNGQKAMPGVWQSNHRTGRISLIAPADAVVTADLDYGPADQASNAGSPAAA